MVEPFNNHANDEQVKPSQVSLTPGAAIGRPSVLAVAPTSLRFQPIHMRRTFEEICERIREQLALGVLKPGDKLPPGARSRAAARRQPQRLEGGVAQPRNGGSSSAAEGRQRGRLHPGR